MARIPQYQRIDYDDISANDVLLGTDAENSNLTKNFAVSDLKNYIESGIDLTLKAPHGYIGTVNLTEDDYAIAGVREDLVNLTANISFYVTGDHEEEHDNVGKGMFRLVADGDGWYFEVEEYKARYYLYSFVGRVITGNFGVNNDEVTFTVDDIVTFSDGKDYYNNPDNGDVVGGGRVFRFNITRANAENWPLMSVSNSYTEFHINLVAQTDEKTLQQATMVFASDVEIGKARIEQIDADYIIFDGDDRSIEGVRFGGLTDTSYAEMYVQPTANNNIAIQGFNLAKLVTNIDADLTGLLDQTGNTSITGNLDLGSGRTLSSHETEFQNNVFITSSRNLEFPLIKDQPDGQNQENLVLNINGIEKRDFRNAAFPIEYVRANNNTSRQDSNDDTVQPSNRGILQQLQIGDDYWTVDTATHTLAQVIPGLQATIAPIDADANDDDTNEVVEWFYGIDDGNTAQFKGKPVGTPEPTPDIQINSVTHTFPAGDDKTNVNNYYNNIPLGQRLFFTNFNLPSDIADGDTVTPGVGEWVVEVVQYVDATGVITFSLMGGGDITISSNNLYISNLPNQVNNDDFVTIDLNGGSQIGRRKVEDIAGLSSIMNYTDQVTPSNNGIVNSITFEGGPDKVSGTGGHITVNLEPVVNIGNGSPRVFGDTDDNTTLNTDEAYILGPITGDANLRLPADPGTGSTITIFNISDIDSDGNQMESGGIWMLIPNGTDKIMNKNETLTLNDAASIDLVWSGVAAVGWLIK